MWWLIPVMVAISFLSVGLAFYLTVAIRVVNKYLTPEKRTEEYLIEYESREKGLDPTKVLLPCRRLELKSRGGYPLVARYFAAERPSNITIVSLHGHNSCWVSQLKYLHIFRALGYNVLIPDHRASGSSGGNSITFGWSETTDVKLFINQLQAENPDMKWGIYGESMGGAIALRLAADIAPMFVISYAAYNTLKQLFDEHSKNKARYFMPAIYAVAYLKTKAKLWRINGVKTIKKIDCPILLMHSRGDKLISASNEKALFDAAHSANKQVTQHLFEASRHTRSWSAYPEEFEQTINDFVQGATGLDKPQDAGAAIVASAADPNH